MKLRVIPTLAALCMAFGLSLAEKSAAQTSPVVVELFTSQGCSSCPPADALLHEFANRSDVIALALHVDYWDYIGWADTFASPAYTRRQRGYARAANRRMVYTPQMIVAGEGAVNGHKPSALLEQLRNAATAAPRISLNIQRHVGVIQIEAKRLDRGLGTLDVHLVRYIPKAHVDIRRGENAGRILEYSNIVRSFTQIRRWSGERDLSMQTRAEGDDPVVILIQKENHGPILAAARLF